MGKERLMVKWADSAKQWLELLPRDSASGTPRTCAVLLWTTKLRVRGSKEIKKKNNILAGRKLSCFCNACKEEKGLCDNSEFVQPFEIYKMKPSKPVDAEVDKPNIPVPVPEETEMRATSPVLTSTDIPQVGQWVEIKGTVEGKRKQDMSYFANVVSRNFLLPVL
ncbi:hypothetical protein ElyMa_001687200 [Elysia marginata]|uniref:Uncharacterized protein n=1 Tax=Elysia marginata TaxID=1093978 RepID=A0AAV4JUL8_9GAST|nr:hypothetical protein ElyMa_001687200 [Elysia marginata]